MIMTDPKVTVMMIVYNSEKYMNLAIDSILNQTLTDFELLIIDACSSDKSPAIIKSYNDYRIRVIRNPENRGVGYSRKIALEQAKGEYVAILDSDDIAFRDRLQVQVNYLDSHQDIHMIGSAYQVINEVGEVEKTIYVPIDKLTIRWTLLFSNCIANSSVMYRKEYARKIGGYDGYMLTGEDFDLWIRFAAYGRIVQFDRPLIQWRRHSKSLQHTEPLEAKDCIIETVRKSIQLQVHHPISFEIAKCLKDGIDENNMSKAIIFEAFDTIFKCRNHFISKLIENDHENREKIEQLSTHELFRISTQKDKSWYAFQLTMLHLVNQELNSMFSIFFIIFIARIIIPTKITKKLMTIKFINSIIEQKKWCHLISYSK